MQGVPGPDSAPISRQYVIGVLALAAGVCAVTLWPEAPPWRAIPGHPFGETDNHVWMFWRAVRGLTGDARLLVNAPAGLDLPLMDPVNLPVVLALWWAGPGLAWSGLRLWNTALALAGGWRLSRELAGPRGAIVGMVSLGAAPYLAGMFEFGVSECWPVGWLALHLSFLLSHARSGARRDAVLAGLCLGAAALSGWYMALFTLIAEIMVVPALLWRARRPGLVWQGLIGLAMALPALVIHLRADATGELWRGRFHGPTPEPLARHGWQVVHLYGADLLAFVTPRPDMGPMSQPVYLGLVTLGLAVWGLARSPRRVAPLLAAAGVFVALACGYWPTLGGAPMGVAGPAQWVVALAPPLVGITHWHRAISGALPFLAAAAAIGASSLPSWRGLPVVFGLAVLAESVLLCAVPWPRTSIPTELPEVLAALPEAGGVIELPFDNGREPFSQTPARLYNRWQVLHGRQVSENYEARDALLDESSLIASFDRATGLRFTGPPSHRPRERNRAPPTGEGALSAERARLLGWGYRWVVLHTDRAPRPEAAIEVIEAALGPGTRVSDGVWWDLQAP